MNSGEGFLTTLGMYTSDEWTEEVNKNWMNGLAPNFLLYNQSDTQLTNDINDFYLNASLESGSIDFRKDILGFTNIFSDRLYIHASMEAVRIQAKLSPVYLYYNDYITDANTIGLGMSTFEKKQKCSLFDNVKAAFEIPRYNTWGRASTDFFTCQLFRANNRTRSSRLRTVQSDGGSLGSIRYQSVSLILKITSPLIYVYDSR